MLICVCIELSVMPIVCLSSINSFRAERGRQIKGKGVGAGGGGGGGAVLNTESCKHLVSNKYFGKTCPGMESITEKKVWICLKCHHCHGNGNILETKYM